MQKQCRINRYVVSKESNSPLRTQVLHISRMKSYLKRQPHNPHADEKEKSERPETDAEEDRLDHDEVAKQ